MILRKSLFETFPIMNNPIHDKDDDDAEEPEYTAREAWMGL